MNRVHKNRHSNRIYNDNLIKFGMHNTQKCNDVLFMLVDMIGVKKRISRYPKVYHIKTVMGFPFYIGSEKI